jgi:hypothetical protein
VELLYIQSEARQDIAFHLPPARVTGATHLIFSLSRCGEEMARLLDTMNTGQALPFSPRRSQAGAGTIEEGRTRGGASDGAEPSICDRYRIGQNWSLDK